MNLFAVNTLKEIAALICGTDGDGPVYRQYWEIRNFFAAAGWTDVPPFESGRGYGRNRWTYDLLLERQDDPEAIAQVIRRLADRREYPKSPDMPFVVCELLNKVLAVEDLRIEYSHGHPQLNAQGLPSSRVDAVIARAGLDEVGHRKAGGYSLGMRQRLGLAAEMLGDPPVLLLDEPSNGLDPEGIAWMRRYLRALAAEGRAVLVSSHLMSELEDTGTT
ncbi:MAG: ATP-binding cassette domain-containing protein [Trebonia sp.]